MGGLHAAHGSDILSSDKIFFYISSFFRVQFSEFSNRLGQSKFTDLGFSVTNLHFSITDLNFFLSPPLHPSHRDLDNFCLQFKKNT